MERDLSGEFSLSRLEQSFLTWWLGPSTGLESKKGRNNTHMNMFRHSCELVDDVRHLRYSDQTGKLQMFVELITTAGGKI